MTTVDDESSRKCSPDPKLGCGGSHGQASRSVLDNTPHQTEVNSESLDHKVDSKGLGSVPVVLGQPEEAQATRPKRKRPRQKGLVWTQKEHGLFLEGVEMYGKGNWNSIAKNYVRTRTSAQVASHAQKHFGRMKKDEKPARGRRRKKSKVSKGSSPVIKPSIVHPTFFVPPSDNGKVPPTYSNPPTDFRRLPLSHTNTQWKEFCRFHTSVYFPSVDSATFSLTNPNHLSRSAEVDPTSYAPQLNTTNVRVFPTLYVPPLNNNDPSCEDVSQLSNVFAINPTSDNTTIHPNPFILPSENTHSNSDPHIPSQDSVTLPPSAETNVHSTIFVPPSNDEPTNPNVDFPSLDFLSDISLESIPASPLYCSFKFTDLDECPTLDFLDIPPMNINSDIHNIIQVPPSDVDTSHQIASPPQNDFGVVQPSVSDVLPMK